MNTKVLASRFLLAALIICLTISLLPTSLAATAEVSGFSITPTQAAYYIGETPTILIKFNYENIANNTQLQVLIYNSSDDLMYTISITLTGDASLLNGTYEQQHNLASNFTEEAGSKTYKAKLVDTSTGYKLGETSFKINVETENIMLLVSWIDSDQNRQIDVNEQITFSIFIQWSFVNQSKSATLYVVSSGSEITITTVSITAGSGQETASWQTTFSSKGNYVVTFKLKDANGDVLATASVTISVGQQETQTSIWSMFKLEHFVIGALLIIIIALFVREKRD